MLKNKMSKARSTMVREYAEVNAHPVVKAIVQNLVMIVDIFIMFLLIWHLCTYFIPRGSWINVVNGDSMYPTMHSGQIIFTDTSSSVSRGDVVTANVPNDVFEYRPDLEGMAIVKRVIGVPGDSILINEAGVYVNGELLIEDYLTDAAKQNTYVKNKHNYVELDENEYFVMGDNRGASYDSRSFGVVDASCILYKQSDAPTTNFYLKLILVIIIFILDVFLYALIEFILMECAYGLIYRNRIKNCKVCDKTNSNNTTVDATEAYNLKGENE